MNDMMIDAAAFAVTADLLAVVADLPAATARHSELATLLARAAAVQSAFTAAQQDFEQYKRAEHARLAKLESAVAERRRIVVRLESDLEQTEFSLLNDEADWSDLGIPADAPYRQTVRAN